MKKIYYRWELVKELDFLRGKGMSIGFVPTMGALHKGHASLVEESSRKADICVTSIFVNPKQFDDEGDLNKYPSTIEEDCKLLELSGCNIVFIPSYEEVYPKKEINLNVDLSLLETVFEGKHRIGHFEGVLQVLYHFFDIIKPNYSFFGQKDYQQCMVVDKLCQAYFQELELVFCPIVRENGGLAMSSRNKRLSEKSRKDALTIFKVLNNIKSLCAEIPVKDLLKSGKVELQANNFDVEYLAIASRSTLEPQEDIILGKSIVLVAAKIGEIRLIDNMLV